MLAILFMLSYFAIDVLLFFVIFGCVIYFIEWNHQSRKNIYDLLQIDQLFKLCAQAGEAQFPDFIGQFYFLYILASKSAGPSGVICKGRRW